MKKPTITIVIPAYNEAERLADCLDAIALQSDKPDEVIVVDNNSVDQTAEIALRYPFVTLTREKRQGIVFARDHGFDAATSDVIARIDADTVIERDWVERVRAFYRFNDAALGGSCYFYNVPYQEVGRRITNGLLFHYNFLITGYYPLWGSNMALTRKQWRKIRSSICQRNGLHEDFDISAHLHLAGIQIVFDQDLIAGVAMRRGFQTWAQRWEFAAQWPRTFREHHQSGWPLAVLGASFIFITSWVPSAWVKFDQGLTGLRRLFALDRH